MAGIVPGGADISSRELNWLLDGLSVYQKKAHKQASYSAVL